VNAPRVALYYLLAVVIGIVLLVVLFTWVLVDSYQSVDLPSTPMPLRIVAVLALYALAAGLLAFASREATWEWGLRIALPMLVVLGIASLLNGPTSPDGLKGEALMAGLLAAGCAGSWLGSRLALQRVQKGV
jgi:peptidoglycan/LPS O-acetylase OafA/YrhL